MRRVDRMWNIEHIKSSWGERENRESVGVWERGRNRERERCEKMKRKTRETEICW